ncbi:MAG: ribosome-binding factor A [Deltaproteobacteria bacterium]|nr:MAG: ribosome-binding factor A [Deltaproteobacteria bacterium]
MQIRSLKISKEIQKILSLQILKSPAFITILNVKMSKNLKNAMIFFSLFGPEELCKKTLHWIKFNSASLQHMLSQNLKIRHTPNLSWYFVNNKNEGSIINKII